MLPPATSPDDDARSPCIGVCRVDAADVCIGCGRSIDEILRWIGMDDDERRAVRARAAARLAANAGPGIVR